MNGYAGSVLRVDLSTERIETETVDAEVWENVIGGVGYGAYVLLDEVPADADPLGPDNKLVFATGPFQATQFPGAAKFSAIAKSPVNGFYGESAAGSHWGVALKETGHDAIIIEGEADRPLRLHVTEDGAELLDAESLWGRDAYETNEAIWAAEDADGEDELSTAAIGQAGENEVRFAAVTVDNHSFLGRSGMGAVMGSKRLKAVSIPKGSSAPEVANPESVRDLKRDLAATLAQDGADFREHGTPGYLAVGEEYGDVPTKNWADGEFEGNETLSAPRYTEEILEGRLPCIYCPLACHRDVSVASPQQLASDGAGPEYETLAMLGQNCLIDDLKAVTHVNEMANRYGIDTISLGGTLAFLMEAQERGDLVFDAEIDFEWGNEEALVEFTEKVAKREGIGDLAADGITALSDAVDGDDPAYAVQTKGVVVPAHDPRAFFAVSLNYATGVRGPGHERGNLQLPYLGGTLPEAGITSTPDRFDLEGAAYLTARYQDWSSLWNSLVVCRFMTEGGMTFSDMHEMYNETTGAAKSRQELLHDAERVFQLQRLANVKFGVTAADDELPPRLLEDTGEGGHEGEVPGDYENHLDEYYDHRGWDEDGIPTRDTLRQFDIPALLDGSIPQVAE